MKRTYINPEMIVVPFVATQVIAESPLSNVSGADGLEKGNGYFKGGAADVKEGSSAGSVWDEEW